MSEGQQAWIEGLKQIVGERYVLTGSVAVEPYVNEWTQRFHGKCLAVVRPSDTEQVSRVLRFCNEASIPVVPQAGNTGLVAGATCDASGRSVVLSVERLDRIDSIDTVNDTMTVGAGLILQKAQEAAQKVGRLFPLSFAAEGSARIGGIIGTNAGGTAVLRYGNTRELVLGLEVVLADGRVLNMLRGLRKDNTGYDLKQLFIGSEGTLGVVTRAVLKLFPIPNATYTALAAVESVEATCELLKRARSRFGAMLTGFEIMQGKCLTRVAEQIDNVSVPETAAEHPWWCLLEVSLTAEPESNPIEALLEEAFEADLVTDAVVANSIKESLAIWQIRESVPSADAHVGGNLHNDVSIAISDMPAFIEESLANLNAAFPWIDPSLFGHLGDGNLHFNIGSIPPALAFENEEAIRDIVYERVVAHNGSISAEHGIGQLKREHFLALKNPEELAVMVAIKRLFDPKSILNPGKLLPD